MYLPIVLLETGGEAVVVLSLTVAFVVKNVPTRFTCLVICMYTGDNNNLSIASKCSISAIEWLHYYSSQLTECEAS